ncbi:Aprataxin [Trypanosoma melophagium]|uniref:Aprataxin n=1 Tax=Trypanosoma melophagium TaxID=715481 RepID=UPI00351A3470|nr:Aprataxin [Trypanosoma melophagium]
MKPTTLVYSTNNTIVGNGPRTRLPFLRKVVQNALRQPNTHNTANPFKPYPLLRSSEEKQRVSQVLYKDPQCIVVNDAYPKSKVHCLIMPLDLSLDSLNAIRTEHIPLMQHLLNVAEQYVQFMRRGALAKGNGPPALKMMTGFHSLPSLPQLHLHLISMDFETPYMKTRKHYNSFATPFFLSADRVLEDLQQNGCITLNRNVAELKRMEEQETSCLWCGHGENRIPQLKLHLQTCPKSRAVLSTNTSSSSLSS